MRSLSRLIWLTFDVDAPDQSENAKSRHERLERKRRSIRLVVFFLYATKHHLRGEHGMEYEDYKGLLPDDLRIRWSTSADRLEAARQGFASTDDDEEVGRRASWYGTSPQHSTAAHRAAEERRPLRRATLPISSRPQSVLLNSSKPPMTVPLLALHEVGLYAAGARKSGMLEQSGPAGYSAVLNALASLTTELGNMER